MIEQNDQGKWDEAGDPIICIAFAMTLFWRSSFPDLAKSVSHQWKPNEDLAILRRARHRSTQGRGRAFWDKYLGHEREDMRTFLHSSDAQK